MYSCELHAHKHFNAFCTRAATSFKALETKDKVFCVDYSVRYDNTLVNLEPRVSLVLCQRLVAQPLTKSRRNTGLEIALRSKPISSPEFLRLFVSGWSPGETFSRRPTADKEPEKLWARDWNPCFSLSAVWETRGHPWAAPGPSLCFRFRVSLRK